MELKGKVINFLGDSITEGYGSSSDDKRFTDLIYASANLSKANNYGIGGTRYAKQKTVNDERVDLNEFSKRYVEMDDNADLIVMFGGTNDYGHGDAEFGTFDDRTNMTFCGAVHMTMKGLIEKYPTTPIVILTPLHRANENVKNTHGKVLKDYVDVIRKCAEYYSLPLLDLYSSAGICPDIEAQKNALTIDGLHPNDAGYQKLADIIQKFLERL